MNQGYRIAAYLRLSKEDEDMRDESNSISSQRMMIREYVRKHFENFSWSEFSDDGYSGTNFRRPGVTDLLEQVKSGRIDCVIVKDFSRFSRDYIELGSYLDQIFPFLGVRFISLNDYYDSEKQKGSTADLGISFRGLMYDLYSRDLSMKVKASLHTRKEQGQYAMGNVPFGYERDQTDRHKLVIAKDEANVIRRIFSLTLEGKTTTEIAKQLNREKVPTPMGFRAEKKQTSRVSGGSGFQWSHSRIYSILKNPVYAGDMVCGKYHRKEIGGKNHVKPGSEWNVYRDHHPAIVSRDTFEKVQKNRKRAESGKPRNMACRHPLQGKVFCGGCKKSMALRKRSLNPYFYCHARYAYADAENCVDHVNLMFLEQVVLYRMEEETTIQQEMKRLRGKERERFHEKIEKLTKIKNRLIRKRENLQRERMERYERSVFDEEFQFQTDDTEIRQAEERIAGIDQEIAGLKEAAPEMDTGFMDFSENSVGGQLTKQLVEALIRRIVVYDEEHIEIEFVTWK